MVLSQHTADLTLKNIAESIMKKMSLQLLLCLMYLLEIETNDSASSYTYASDLAAKSEKLPGVSKSSVYHCYKEWRLGQKELAIAVAEDRKEFPVDDQRWFEKDNCGSYERKFLLNKEALNIIFSEVDEGDLAEAE